MTTAIAEPPTDGLVSGEAVHLDIRVARAGSRVLALLIDMISQFATFVVLALVALIGLAATGLADAALGGTAWVLIIVTVFVGHQAVWETVTQGRTPGKFVMGLRVVRDDGGPIRFRHAVVRALIGAAVEWPGLLMPLVTWAASLITMATNPQSKRLGDLAAGTLVIHERSPATWGWIPVTPPPLAAWAATLDLTGLDDELALSVRHFLARSRQLKEPFRTRLGMRLAGEVLAKTNPPPPPNTPGWAYLAAVLGERHRRTAARLSAARAAHATLWPELFPQLPPLTQQPWTAPAPWPTAYPTGSPGTVRPPAPRSPAPHS
ncbi:RDD family protein [Hamadaea sp. NPDC051192]|uniref:RDD family protein n=1 Tax=Hamadaea sp. NPDC051192 TaxID=3154940 RepID=UPI00343CE97F